MRAAVRGAFWAALRLLLVLGLLVAFAAWWRHEKEPDFRVDRRLRLLPVRAAEPAPDANLGGETRDAIGLRCGQTLRYEFTAPGDHAVLRFLDGHIMARPELSMRLLGPSGLREIEHHETSEQVWTARRVPLPVDAGEPCTLELAALDGQGRAGLGTVYLADVVLESDGRGVDETEITMATRAVEQDLLARRGAERRFAPATRESARIAVEGPACVPLGEDEPLWFATEAVPADARLELALHIGRPWPEAPVGSGEVSVLVADEVLATLPYTLEAAGSADAASRGTESRELSASLDLSRFAGRSLNLGLRRSGAPSLWVGVRDLSISTSRRVPRSPFVAGHGRNVLLVVVDSLRGDRFGAAGWTAAHTPVLDGLALRGGRWSRVLSPSSWSLPNVASLLTGVSPLTHGLGVWPRAQLSPRLPTLAQNAAWSGYATGLFSSSVVTGRQFGLDRGFEHAELGKLSADILAERAIDWLVDASQFEWFLVLHLADPSFPYDPLLQDLRSLPSAPPPALVERLRKLDSRPGAAEAVAVEVGTRYDGELAGVDRAIGKITDWLAARDLLNSTLIAVVGSSGEEFYEHGGRLHGQTLWDEVVSVPLVMAGPGVRGTDGGAFAIDEPISLLDVTRMLVEYGHVSTRGGLQGRLPPPFGPLLPEPVFHALLRPVPGVTEADLDATRTRRWLRLADHADGTVRLFDRLADPGSRKDLLTDTTLNDKAQLAARLEAEALGTSLAEWERQSLLSSLPAAEPGEPGRP